MGGRLRACGCSLRHINVGVGGFLVPALLAPLGCPSFFAVVASVVGLGFFSTRAVWVCCF